MRVDRFGRTLAFAALAALFVPCASTVLGTLVGRDVALNLVLAGTAAAFVSGLAPERRSWVYAVGVTLLALPMYALSSSLGQVAVLSAFVVSSGRLLVRGRARLARSLPRELILSGGGLALAWLFAGASPLGPFGLALGVWSYFLVQSLAFIFHAPTPFAGAAEHPDPFERARSSLLDLLQDEARPREAARP